MAWSQPKTWSSDKITDAVLNAEIRDKMDALKDPPSDNYNPASVSATNLASTSSTSFVDIDANLETDITTYGGDILVVFSCYSSIAIAGYFDIAVDGGRLGGSDGLIACSDTNQIELYWLITGKPANTYNIKMQYKTSSSVSVSLVYPPQFIVREVS